MTDTARQGAPVTMQEWLANQTKLSDRTRELMNGIISGMPTTCANLCKTELRREIVAQLIVAKDLAKEITGAALDMPVFMGEMAKILPDAFYDFDWNGSYLALDVMRQILYILGPESRTVKKGKNPDVNWRIHLGSNMTAENLRAISKTNWCLIGGQADDGNAAKNKQISDDLIQSFAPYKTIDGNYAVPGCIIISTFKNGNAPTASPTLAEGNGRSILLTMKQATILGLYILRKFTTLANNEGMQILTPLAGAIFSRNNLPKMLNELEIKASLRDMPNLIDAINKSAQNGGQFLNGSRTDIAAACVIAGTSNVKKLEERESICKRTIKQYYSANRPAEKGVFLAMCKYATGGLPEGWTFEMLLQEAEATSRAKMAAALRETEATVQIPEN